MSEDDDEMTFPGAPFEVAEVRRLMARPISGLKRARKRAAVQQALAADPRNGAH